MKSIKFYTTLILSVLAINLSGQGARQVAVEQFVNATGLEHASIGFCVKDFSGSTLVSYNADKSYTPASILKIVTTATALEVLGADYRYSTALAKGEDRTLIISGTGDPTLGTEHLNNNKLAFVGEWADKIVATFGETEDMKILVKDDYFGYAGLSRKWVYEDIGNYYASGAYGISVFDNTYRLTFNTEDRSKGVQLIKIEPKMDMKFNNTLSLNSTGQDNGYILGAPFSYERTLTGNIPANRKQFTLKGSIPDPGLFLGTTIGDALEIRGIDVSNVSTTFATYHDEMYADKKMSYPEAVFYEHKSPALSDIIRNVNEKSNNHYAEHLLRTTGRVKNPDIYSPALDEGIEKVKAVWTNKGLDTDALFMYDGSGLAPSNAISAELLCDILAYMQKESQYSMSFLNSLPQAGKEGTVRNFLKGTRLEGKVMVKSGSIANVQCYAGYYIDGEKKYAFTIMVNNYNAPRRQVVKAIEKLLIGVFD